MADIIKRMEKFDKEILNGFGKMIKGKIQSDEFAKILIKNKNFRREFNEGNPDAKIIISILMKKIAEDKKNLESGIKAF